MGHDVETTDEEERKGGNCARYELGSFVSSDSTTTLPIAPSPFLAFLDVRVHQTSS